MYLQNCFACLNGNVFCSFLFSQYPNFQLIKLHYTKLTSVTKIEWYTYNIGCEPDNSQQKCFTSSASILNILFKGTSQWLLFRPGN